MGRWVSGRCSDMMSLTVGNSASDRHSGCPFRLQRKLFQHSFAGTECPRTLTGGALRST